MTTDRYGPHTALLVVDVQNDFADPDGGLYVEGGEEIVPLVNEEIAAARAAGALVVYTQDWHPPTTPHFAKDGGVWPVHCVRDTWGAELHPDLDVAEDALVVRKGVDGEDGYSGFSVRDPVSGDTTATELGSYLDAAQIRRVVVTGLAGDVCVKETALDAARLGYEVVVPLTTTRMVELNEGDGEAAVAAMRAAGAEVEAA
ncbi:MAG: isochorismatase family protein [Nitriliruptoraceae bacterium]